MKKKAASRLSILIALTYYRPHISGLTIYVERLARGLAGLGHRVTVLTSHYDLALPYAEVLHKVRVVRAPVAFHLSKGVIQPTLPWLMWKLARQSDLASIHLPQGESGLLATIARLAGRPVALTYHCDLRLPSSPLSGLVGAGVSASNHLAARFAQAIVTNTRDYAERSPYLAHYLDKVHVITPPIEMPEPAPGAGQAFRVAHGLEGGPFIGMATRLAAEKGVEILVDALPAILERYPQARVLFVGPDRVIGEEAYARKLAPMLERYSANWIFLGHLPDSEMPAFYAACDCLVTPSLNSTESFGIVQAEGMLCGAPAVASDLPGVRQPIRMTGMGEIAPVGDSGAFGQSVLRVLDDRARYVRPRPEVEAMFSARRTVEQYETLFQQLIAHTVSNPRPALAPTDPPRD